MISGLTDTATAAARTAGVGLAAEVGPVAKDTEFDDVAGIADIGTAEMAADIRPADEAAGNIPEAAEDYHIVVAVEALQTLIETADRIVAAKAAADVVATAKSSRIWRLRRLPQMLLKLGLEILWQLRSRLMLRWRLRKLRQMLWQLLSRLK